MGKFLLGNPRGGYYFEGDDETSYQGLTFLDNWELIKVLDRIEIDDELQGIEEKKGVYTKINKKSSEKFYYKNSQEFVYEARGSGVIKIFLDCRNIHDYNDEGRIYEISKNSNTYSIKYTKYEDTSLTNKKYEINFELKAKNVKKEDEWIEKNYSYDKKRGTANKLYVYHAFTTNLENEKCKIKIKYPQNKIKQKRINLNNYQDKSFNALERLRIDNEIEGILAGYPWFYQVWTRDELISLKPYIIKKDDLFVKKVLKRHLNNINEEGMVNNRHPHSELGSIDSTGWLAKRLYEHLRGLKKLKPLYTHEELTKMYETLRLAEINLRKNRMKKDFIYNKSLETWMDTGKENSTRKGYRVEIQFLYHHLLKTLNYLAELINIKPRYDTEEFKQRIRKHFITEEGLIDGIDEEPDFTKRPNVFLAHYISKEILTKEEWEKTFDKVLEECWLEWGGLSSISKNNDLFENEYTGMNNKSYHHGDSWYYINNIASIAMHDLNNEKYKDYVKKILEASIEDMETGIVGSCSEISSASKRKNEGALVQAWSASTLYELTNLHNL